MSLKNDGVMGMPMRTASNLGMPLIESGAKQVPGGDVAGTVEEPGSSKVSCAQVLSCTLLSMLLSSASCLSCKGQAFAALRWPHVFLWQSQRQRWVHGVLTQPSGC